MKLKRLSARPQKKQLKESCESHQKSGSGWHLGFGWFRKLVFLFHNVMAYPHWWHGLAPNFSMGILTRKRKASSPHGHAKLCFILHGRGFLRVDFSTPLTIAKSAGFDVRLVTIDGFQNQVTSNLCWNVPLEVRING